MKKLGEKRVDRIAVKQKQAAIDLDVKLEKGFGQ